MITMLVIVISGMIAIAIFAYFLPKWLPAWESTLGSIWIIVGPILYDLFMHLYQDQSWTELIPQKYVMLAMIFLGVMNLILRRMNLDRDSS